MHTRNSRTRAAVRSVTLSPRGWAVGILALAAAAAITGSGRAEAAGAPPAGLHLAQATTSGSGDAMMRGMMERMSEKMAGQTAAAEAQASEPADTATGGATPGATMSGSQGGMGMMGRGMMSGGKGGMGRMGMHGAGDKMGCRGKGRHAAPYDEDITARLERIEKRQILIETMLREIMLGRD